MSGIPEDLRFLDVVLSLQGGEAGNLARARRGLDRERFHHWCLRHQIGGLVYLLVEDLGLQLTGWESISAGLRGAYLEQWARTERLRLSLLTLDARMRAIGEDYLVLKGLPFAQRYYGASDRRATGDLDIWVHRDRAGIVAQALVRAGLTRRSPAYGDRSPALDHVHQVELDLDGTGVELHHALRVHPTFRIDEAAIWSSRTAVAIQDGPAPGAAAGLQAFTLSDEHALLLLLLGLHTDVQIAEVQARWFVDLHQLLLVAHDRIDWDAFLAARTVDGTRRICVNALAMFLMLTRRDDGFPALSAAVAARREDLVGVPDRAAYLALLRGDSLLQRKGWPLRQYEGGRGPAVSWWLAGLPHRIAAKPAAFAEDVTAARVSASPWAPPAGRQTPSIVSELGVDADTLQDTHLRLGSLVVLVRAERASDIDAIRELYRLRTDSVTARGTADLTVHLVSLDGAAPPRLPTRPIVEHPVEGRAQIHEGIVHAWVEERDQVMACLAIDRAHETRAELLHGLMVVMNRILARLGRYHLHAAAAGLGGATWLFVGAKGSGKSTISLSLGKAGATVFSEDHVMVRREAGTFLVSGCDGDLHLTADTERHFFDVTLAGEMVERAGVPKRRVSAASIVRCQPYVDTPIRGIVFPRVDDTFALHPLAKEDALARLIAPLAERHRFVDAADRAAFLGSFAALVDACDTWDLSLSRNLSELTRLETFLRTQTPPAPAPTPAPATGLRPPVLAP